MRCLTLLPFLATPALAWEHTVEYRFLGSELTGHEVTEGADEDPALLQFTLSDGDGNTRQFEIESDLGLGACPKLLSLVQGNPDETVVLTANLNARTLNGVDMPQCSLR